MKNLTQLPNIQKCADCKKEGFFCHYDKEMYDCIVCPICETPDFENTDDFLDGIFSKVPCFCVVCCIIFMEGCSHYNNSSCIPTTTLLSNSHFINKWKYNDEVFIGMPQFDSEEEYKDKIDNIQILEWICFNNGAKCMRSTGEFASSFTESDDLCCLKKNKVIKNLRLFTRKPLCPDTKSET